MVLRLVKWRILPGSLRRISSFNGVDLLPVELTEKLFGPKPINQVSPVIQKQIVSGLKRFGQIDLHQLKQKVSSPSQSEMFDKLLANFPNLHGRYLDAHFRFIANQQTDGYLMALEKLRHCTTPPKPLHWQFTSGWTRYDGDLAVSVEFPSEPALVFDCEVSVNVGPMPVIAVALSPTAWYSWTSPLLFQENVDKPVLSSDLLIPMECSLTADVNESFDEYERIIVGHNVGYDRSRIRDQYRLKRSKLRFLDTMSMHISVCGLASDQRTLYKAQKKSRMDTKAVADIMRFVGKPSSYSHSTDLRQKTMSWNWVDVTSENSLDEVHRLHCAKSLTKVNKDIRDVFVKGDLNDVKRQFQELMSYCSIDVSATNEVLQNLLPKFLERFPHPVTFAGMLEMGVSYLPVDDSWNTYIRRADEKYAEERLKLKKLLIDTATATLDSVHQRNPWMWSVDWKMVKLSKKRGSRNRLKQSDSIAATAEEKLYPKWFKELCATVDEDSVAGEPTKVSPAMRITPKLLKLAWFCYPLHCDAGHGWGYLVPGKRNLNEFSPGPEAGTYLIGDEENAIVFPYAAIEAFVKRAKENFKEAASTTKLAAMFVHGGRTPCDQVSLPGCHFYKLPHKNGPTKNVGTPFSQDYMEYIETGKLNSSYSSLLLEIIKIKNSISYWTNNRDRIKDQMVVWNRNMENISGAILPQIVPAGTITRRAVEPTWLTASNAYEDKIGSELKGMVRAPAGYNFVGADVDVEEMWIAAILGDANLYKIHGSTPFSWRLYQGNKADGTDQHTVVAKELKVSRDEAKILNFGRLYGGNRRFAAITLKKFNPLITQANAVAKADQLYSSTKGRHLFVLKKPVVSTLSEEEPSFFHDYNVVGDANYWLVDESTLYKLSNHCKVPIKDLTDGMKWYGGSESDVFNALEAIASANQPATPVLQCRISQALEPLLIGENFQPVRINWVVQSSAVDYLHLILTCMHWIMTEYGISGRFAISIHDEVRYLVAKEDSHRAALALQLTNLLTRAVIANNVGFTDLPTVFQSVAFFARVDIDQTIRKEVYLRCETPSNPGGLRVNYGVKNGTSLTIEDIVEVTCGSLSASDSTATELSQVNS